jgi:mono/diheme cytochrome c family protein
MSIDRCTPHGPAIFSLAAAGSLHAAAVAADSVRGAVLTCVQCHSVNGKGGTVAPDLGAHAGHGSKAKPLTDTVAMWNQDPRIPAAPSPLDLSDMREIAGYLWAVQFLEDAGSPAAGARVFKAEHGAVCHSEASSGALQPTGKNRWFGAAAMVSALWHHDPGMFDRMKSKGIAWPRFDGSEMAGNEGPIKGK